MTDTEAAIEYVRETLAEGPYPMTAQVALRALDALTTALREAQEENERVQDFRAEIVVEAFTAPDADWNVILDSLRARISDLDALRAELQAKDEALQGIAEAHVDLERDPAQHCTNLVRAARRALTPPTKEGDDDIDTSLPPLKMRPLEREDWADPGEPTKEET